MKTHKPINKIVDCNLWYGENKQGASIENEDQIFSRQSSHEGLLEEHEAKILSL